MTQALGGLFSNHSPLLFVAMTVLITLVLTNFFSNTATLLVVSSLVSALSDVSHELSNQEVDSWIKLAIFSIRSLWIWEIVWGSSCPSRLP